MKIDRISENGIMKFANGIDAVSGNTLAEMLEIRHFDLMQTIERVIEYEKERKSHGVEVRSEKALFQHENTEKDKRTLSFISKAEINHIKEEKDPSFNAIFKKWEYTDSMNRKRKTYVMNEDALYLVIANTQGQKAHALKVQFKSEFNEMRIERGMREISKQRSQSYTDELLLLQARLKEEGSGSSPFIITTMQQKIHKKATGRATNRKGIDHDTLSGKEDFKIAKLRKGVAKILGRSHHLTAREARDEAYKLIKDFK